MRGRAVVIGGGSYGEVYLHYLKEEGVDVDFILDDDDDKKGQLIQGVPIKGGLELLSGLKGVGITDVYAPIGSNRVRTEILSAARASGLRTPNFVHRSAIVGGDLEENSGVYILAGTIVMPQAGIGRDVMISASVNIAHHSVIEDGVFISTRGNVGANIQVKRLAYVGMGATLVTGKCRVIGPEAMIGAGAVVVSDVAERATVAGVPARPILDGRRPDADDA